MGKKHERIIDVVRVPDSRQVKGYCVQYRVYCACGKMVEDLVWTKREATFAYRDHIDEATAKPSPYEPEVTSIDYRFY